MLELLLLPFTLTFQIFGMVFGLMGSLFRGLFRGMAGLFGLVFSMMFGFWPILLLGGIVSLVMGIVRSLRPLIGVALIAFALVALFKKGVQDGQENTDDAFSQFVRNLQHR